MTENICESLNANGFPVDSFYEDEKHFGNIVIKSRLECGITITLTKDRGLWDCTVFVGNEEIPIVAVIYLLEGTSFEFEELSFDSDDKIIEWLIMQKSTLSALTDESLREAEKKWDIFTKERLKKMMS